MNATPLRNSELYLLRALPSLRSAPGHTSNKTTRRPRSHFFPPSDCTQYHQRPWSWSLSVTFVSYLGTAVAGCAPSAITPAAATPITIANRLPISFLPSVSLHFGPPSCRGPGPGLPMRRGSVRLTARRLRHGGTHPVHTPVSRAVYARAVVALVSPSAGGDVGVLRTRYALSMQRAM